jgi:hypothetical protein
MRANILLIPGALPMARRFLPLVVLVLFAAPVRGEEKPRWLTDHEQAREAARAAGKPIFVVFRCEH